jgi:hypothetical protein
LQIEVVIFLCWCSGVPQRGRWCTSHCCFFFFLYYNSIKRTIMMRWVCHWFFCYYSTILQRGWRQCLSHHCFFLIRMQLYEEDDNDDTPNMLSFFFLL